MNIEIFELERLQSIYENTVDLNLTESGFHPFTLNELLSSQQRNELNDVILGYGQTNGSVALRQRVAALYDGLNEDNVVMTNGSAEANFIACHTLLQTGDEFVMMKPNYMQMWGIVEEMGCFPEAFQLQEENGWAPDLNELRNVVTTKTKMITVRNPSNPTGYILTEAEMREIVTIAEHVGAWIYSDEIYRGSELDGIECTSFIGMYDKVVVNGGLSKAYALPGLRVGWLAGPSDMIDNMWAYHDYTSITIGALSTKIAEWALEPELRMKILNRNRKLLRENLTATQDWVDSQGTLFRFVPPRGGGMAFMHYDFDMNSADLCHWLMKEKSVFILPGDVYGMDNYLRLGIGVEKEYLIKGLHRMAGALNKRFGAGSR